MTPVPATMDLTERREAERQIAQDRRDARRDYIRYAEEAANADLEYRKIKATRYVELRASGETGEGAKIRAEGDAADAKRTCAISTSLAKAAILKIDLAERDSVVVRDIHSTSQKIDGLSP